MTLLNEKGIPTPLVHAMLVSPRSRMDVLSDTEIDHIVSKSKLAKKYAETEDTESAYEMLTAKIEEATKKSEEESEEKTAKKKTVKEEKSTVEKVLDSSASRQFMRTVAGGLGRALLGVLGVGGKSSTKKKSSGWF